jgi:fatty acid desaturase
MNARQLVARGLESEVSKLQRLDDGARLREMALFAAFAASGWGLLFCTGNAAGAVTWGPRGLAVALVAVALNACVLLLHEGMHGTLFRARRLNHVVSVALGACVWMSYTAYQVMHLRHHRYLGDARDPDDYDNYSRDHRVVWALHFVRLLFGSALYLMLIPYYASRYGNEVERRRVVGEYALLAAVYGTLWARVPHAALLWGWVVPLLIVGWLTNLRGFTQHGIGEARDPFLASRDIEAAPWLATLLLHENLHLEHHLFPEVPSYHLGQLAKLVRPRMPRALRCASYGEFLWGFLRATPRMDRTPIGRVSCD